ncbi:TonB-dependent receptor domain-containing protein [Winogradskyella litorisediminis]|uniref:TonB-dependent receptor domain-containing protein n=1 Tax=Winogradskyella litorisediminis TaxID=1156618 RepID=A0ABW3NAC4_9FLAO
MLTKTYKIIILKKYLSLLIFLFSASIFAQIKGKVIDVVTGATLSNVEIFSDNNLITFTNDLGVFNLETIGTFTFKRLGYNTLRFKVKSKDFQIIQLHSKASELNEVVIDANHIPKELKESVSTVSIISQKDIERGNSINISEAVNRSPGVFMQSGALNTNRLTIRGIGSRNLFDTSKIRAYFKDIPLTNGSGETNIEDFELNAISQIKITKGATSSAFGAGLGGTILLNPTNAYLNTTSINTEFTIGSFDLYKSTLNFNHGDSKNSFRGIYSNTTADGFRDNNNYNRQTVTLTTNHFINSKNELTFLGSFVDFKAFIPSSINQDDFENNPEIAAFTWRQSQGFEDSQRGIFGVTWDHVFNSKLKYITSVFTSFRNGFEPRPFNILDEKTLAYGFRSRLLGETKFLKKSVQYTVGGEYFKDNYQSQTFQNLYQDFPAGTGSVQGNQLSDFEENRQYFNLFFEINFDVSDKTLLVAGLNYNQTQYNLDDNFPVSTNNLNQSGSFKFDGIWSPKIGVSHQLSDQLSIYGNISQGFSPISLQETLLPSGQINNDLEPETGWNYEIGSRGSIFKNKLQYNLAVYRLDVRNLLVARRTAQDQFVGVNAGQTLHDGIELSLNASLINETNFSVNSFFNLSINDYKFEEFIDGDNNFSGNDLTGVPSEVLNAGLDFSSKIGFFGNINFQHVGEQPITDSNNLYSENYNLTNFKIGYQKTFSDKIQLSIFYGLNNVFDEKYASQILINTQGFGGSQPRYFYPGNPVNYYAGLNFNYSF